MNRRMTGPNRCLTVVIALACLTVLANVALPQSKQDRKKALLSTTEGNKALAQKEYRAAIGHFDTAIATVATNPDAYFGRGSAKFHLKETDAAITDLTTALTQGYSKPADIYRMRAAAYLEKKDFASAVADIDNARAAAPQDIGLLDQLGDLKFQLKDYRGALSAFEAVLAAWPQSGNAEYNVARTHAALGEVDEQLASAERAIQKNTHMVGESYFLIGHAKQKKGNPAAAIDNYKKSVAADPKYYQVYRNLAEVYRQQNSLFDAIRISEEGLKHFPNDGPLYNDLSWFYSLNDKPLEAVNNGQKATELMPDNPVAFTNLCRALNDAKRHDEAVKACGRALELKPGDGETQFYLARAYDLLGRRSEATPYYRKAVKGLEQFVAENPDYADGYYLLGNAYFSDDQREKAIEAFKKCIDLNPRFVKARFNVGYIFVLKKDKAAAMEQYNELKQTDSATAAKLKAQIDKI